MVWLRLTYEQPNAKSHRLELRHEITRMVQNKTKRKKPKEPVTRH